MTKSNNEWVPDVGQEFSYGCWSWGEKYRSGECGVWGKLKAISDNYLIVENADGKEHPLHREGLMMSPIKTEAEKRRDLAVAEMLELDPFLPDERLGMLSRTDFCKALYDNGFRKPKPLTLAVIGKLQSENSTGVGFDLQGFAKAIEAYIRGESL